MSRCPSLSGQLFYASKFPMAAIPRNRAERYRAAVSVLCDDMERLLAQVAT